MPYTTRFRSRARKAVRRVGKNAVRAVKSRYGLKKKQNLNTNRIAKDVAKLAMMINAEKKYVNQTLVTSYIGQVNVNLTGAICLDVTPMMSEGASENQRNGISVKLHSQFWQCQLQQEVFATIGNRLILELWYNNGSTEDQSIALTNIYQPSIFSGVIDSTSTRNPDHMNDYTLALRRRIYLGADQTASANPVKTFGVPVKFNKGKGRHIRYTGTGSSNYLTDVQNGQMLLILRAENGNASGSTASTLTGIAVTGVSTGMIMKYSWKTWYYDN